MAAYPTFREDFRDDVATEKYGLLLDCAGGIRSLAAEFGVKQGGKAFIVASDASQYALVESEIVQIRALATKAIASITILKDTETIPLGSAVFTASPTITVFLDVAETVDATLIAKTKEKLTKAEENVAKQRKLVEVLTGWRGLVRLFAIKSMPSWPQLEASASNLKETVAQFEKLSLKAAEGQ